MIMQHTFFSLLCDTSFSFFFLPVFSNAEQLEVGLPDLVPQLRPYQLRAAHWMVQREKGNILHHEYVNSAPYCVPIDFIHKNSRMFYNPFK